MVKQALFALTAVLCIILQAARAAPPPATEAEINHLLGLMQNSGCEFFRNGTWYDAQRAAAHLRGKYAALAVNGQIETAEDFIDKAASSSSTSGQAYLIRCGGGAPTTTRQWFSTALARYRGTSGAQSSLRSTPSAACARALPLNESSIVQPDLEIVVDGSHVFGVARERFRFLNGLLAPGGAG
jgi:uncharacterized protein DUF5329